MELSVLNWNVWFEQNIEHVGDFIEEVNPDVVMLQELTRGYIGQKHVTTWEYLAKRLGYEFCVQTIPVFTETEEWAQANGIFSRFPIKQTNRQWLHQPAKPDDPKDQYRGYLEATLDVNGTPLNVATCQMRFFEQGQTPSLENDDELQRLLRLVKHIDLLGGDFNTTEDEGDRFAELSKVMQHAGPDTKEKTWATKPNDFAPDYPTRRYDYVFASRDIRVLGAKILQTEFSDHLPILVTAELPVAA